MLDALLQLAPEADASQRLRGYAEFPDVGETVYEIVRDAAGQLVAEARQVDELERWRWPFVRPSGPNSPQLGPIVTRMPGERDFSPKPVIVHRTLARFDELAREATAHAPIFARALEVVGRDPAAVHAVLAGIRSKDSLRVSLGPPPGADPAYADYLLGACIATDAHGTCAACGRQDTALVTDGLTSLARINLFNRDRAGAFPSVDDERSDRRFAICTDCALALRRFKIEVTPTLECRIGGQAALVIPHVSAGEAVRAAKHARAVVDRIREGTTAKAENRLLWTLSREQALVQFHVLWATVRDQLDDVEGLVTDVPSTRLGALSEMVGACASVSSPVLPDPMSRPAIDLHLGFVEQVLKAPGGKATERLNAAPARRALLRELAAAAYQERQVDPRALWQHLGVVARAHVGVARSGWGWLVPGRGKTAWARQVALVLHFLRLAGVLPMPDSMYVPASERLRPFFEGASGLDSDAKAFAFLLGVLHGKLMSVQAARRVRVESNALTWLKGGNISGRDLPAIYAQTRQKLLEYQTSSEEIRAVDAELARLGLRLGAPIPLDGPTALYFVMLGQSLQPEILPAKPTRGEETA